ncbi:MAG: YdcF family protein [Geminicoccales bacterium]
MTALLLSVAVIAWLAGLISFANSLPEATADPGRKTDSIVVLTGGSDRLEAGLALLAQGLAGKLFVSGVYRGVEVQELLELSQQSPSEMACCVELGYAADNTRGNADETASWMKREGFTSLRLVTASYHMPRSLLEFARALPDAEIVPHPVVPQPFKLDDWYLWPGSAALIATEYNKYLVARFLGPLRDLLP